MSIALYQKYRPKTFAELVNQNHIKITLQNAIEQGKVSHAYLFYGPRAVGKTTTARLLAKAVNCQNRKANESEPCNVCESCLRITEGKDFDVVEIDAASNTGVDNVRDNIIAGTRVAPSKSKYKVYIIDEAHMLSTPAFNALLKTLEEPPKNIIFILATTEIHKVPQTIVSRCQRFDFKRLANQEMVDRLHYIVKAENRQVETGVLENIARHSGGYVRDAETLLGQVLSLDDKNITLAQSEIVIPSFNFNLVIDFIETLVDKNRAKAISLLNNLVEESVDLTQFTKELIEILRKMLFLKIAGELDKYTLGVDQKNEERMFKLKDKAEENFLVSALKVFIEKSKDLSSADIIQLPLEIAVVELLAVVSVPIFQSPASSNIINKVGGTQVQTGVSVEKNVGVQNVGTQNVGAQNLEPNQSAGSAENKELNFNFANTKPAPEIISEIVENVIVSSIDQGLEDILKSWSAVLAEVKKKEASMSLMLGVSRPIKFEGRNLEIGFKHRFHCDTMRNSDKIGKLEKIIKEVLGLDLRVTCIVDLTIEFDPVKIAPQITQSDNLQNISAEEDESLKGLLDMFGGKVVE